MLKPIYRENIHAEAYSMILDKLVRSDVDRSKVLDEAQSLQAVTSKTGWALKWLSDNADFAVRLVAFSAVEGIFFSSSFAVIFWFKFKGLMPGVCFSNDMISRDEALHTEFACELIRLLPSRPGEDVVHSMLAEAAEIEIQFARGERCLHSASHLQPVTEPVVLAPFFFFLESLSRGIAGISVDDMTVYIKYVADQLSRRLGYRPLYHESNPVSARANWMGIELT
jgi:ribonucleoside-diphosphate reductase subunit M2